MSISGCYQSVVVSVCALLGNVLHTHKYHATDVFFYGWKYFSADGLRSYCCLFCRYCLQWTWTETAYCEIMCIGCKLIV